MCIPPGGGTGYICRYFQYKRRSGVHTDKLLCVSVNFIPSAAILSMFTAAGIFKTTFIIFASDNAPGLILIIITERQKK